MKLRLFSSFSNSNRNTRRNLLKGKHNLKFFRSMDSGSKERVRFPISTYHELLWDDEYYMIEEINNEFCEIPFE